VELCSGCGTAVLAGGDNRSGDVVFTTGGNAVAPSLTKNQTKKTRYFSFGDQKAIPGVRQDSNFLCSRCKALQSNDIWKAYDAIRDVDAKVFAEQIKHIVARRRFGMCIVVADATDPEHSAPKNLRQAIGKTPAILVLSKADLMPRLQTKEVKQLHSRIQNIAGTRFIDAFRVSGATGAGIFELAEYLLHHLHGRDVFVVGAANVGKSTLVQGLARVIAPNIFLKGRSSAMKRKKSIENDLNVTSSHLPGTTLQAVRVPCFSSTKHALWDTPGLIQKKAIQYSLFPPHLMEPLARPERIPLAESIRVRAGYSVLIEAAWMDAYESENEEEDDSGDEHDSKEDSNDSDGDYESKGTGKGATKQIRPNHHEEDDSNRYGCVLGRLDIVDIPAGGDHRTPALLLRPYLHPSLRMRVVPTSQAPDHATIPKHFVHLIQSRMRRSFEKDGTTTSLPLTLFKTPHSPEGHVHPTSKERHTDQQRVFMDMSFASLGWLSLQSFVPDFTIKPWVVEGSVWSKRRALYPMNLNVDDVEENHRIMDEDADFVETDEARKRLDDANRKGRKEPKRMEARESGVDELDGLVGRGDIYYDEDDEWY